MYRLQISGRFLRSWWRTGWRIGSPVNRSQASTGLYIPTAPSKKGRISAYSRHKRLRVAGFMPDRFARSLLIGMALLSWDTAPSSGQEYPTQPVKIIVPFVAGGGVDVVARIVAPRLGEELGQSVIIENRGGAGGMLGAAAVAQAPPDGYTLLFGTGSTHGTNPSIYPRLSYDPVRDFVPIVLVSSSPLLLVSATSVHARSVKDLIDLAHARRGKLSYASYGTGSINHLAAELFNAMAEIQANHVPYRGSAPALTDLIAGRISYMFDGVSTSLGYIEAGTMRVLGV